MIGRSPIVGLFHRKKKERLSELQGVPDGTFRCDVCRFVYPSICLCGTVVDTVSGLPPKTYILCGGCAMWLGFREPRFSQGLCFNFSEEQRQKIKPLHKELEIVEKEIALLIKTNSYTDNLEEFLEGMPNLKELVRLRFSLLPQDIIDLSDRLTRSEFVDPAEIKEANKG